VELKYEIKEMLELKSDGGSSHSDPAYNQLRQFTQGTEGSEQRMRRRFLKER